MPKMNVRKGDKVEVITGKDKGKQGEVLRAMPKEGKVVVQGVSVATKHQKARKQGEESSIIKVETPIYACKVMPVCPKCGKATRVGHSVKDGKNVRICRKCGAETVREELIMARLKEQYVNEIAPALNKSSATRA